MKERRWIKENICLILSKGVGSTSVMVQNNGEKIPLCKVRNTNDAFWVDCGYNENYIVVYSRGCMVNQIPLTVEAVYDMANNKPIPVKLNNKVIFEYMCVCKKGFHTEVVIEFLNEGKLNIVEQDEVDDFVRYLTASNTAITRDEISKYIFSVYPNLAKYVNLPVPLTVKNYREIMRDLEKSILRFHIMPNILKEEYTS